MYRRQNETEPNINRSDGLSKTHVVMAEGERRARGCLETDCTTVTSPTITSTLSARPRDAFDGEIDVTHRPTPTCSYPTTWPASDPTTSKLGKTKPSDDVQRFPSHQYSASWDNEERPRHESSRHSVDSDIYPTSRSTVRPSVQTSVAPGPDENRLQTTTTDRRLEFAMRSLQLNEPQRQPQTHVAPFTQDHDGDTVLHLSVILHPEAVEHIVTSLLLLATCLDIQNKLGQTALHLAVITRQPDVVRCLVSRGASLEPRDSFGDTALHIACKFGFGNCFLALVEEFMKRRPTDNVAGHLDLNSILQLTNYEGETCLHLAAKAQDKNIFYQLIYGCNVDVNKTEAKRGMTVLHVAADSNDAEVVATLLSQSTVAVNQTTYDGLTALDFAVSRQWTNISDMLTAAGAADSERMSDVESISDEEPMESD